MVTLASINKKERINLRIGEPKKCQFRRLLSGLNLLVGFACPSDGQTKELTPLFNPRTDSWDAHFRWEGYLVVPLTEVGRVTADVLQFNHERRVLIRKAEELFDYFPPDK